MNDASFNRVGPQVARPALAGWLATTNNVTRTFLAAGQIPGLINMAGGLPAPETYPAAELADIARRAIIEHPAETLGYGAIEGLPELRDAIAARFSTPDLTLTRQNVLITAGGMQGLDLVGKVLVETGNLIAGDFPAYLGALDAWRPRNPTYRNLELGDPGFDPVSSLMGAQFAYMVPNFSNPTGRLVCVAMRQAIVDAAHYTGVWIVEDDPYGALHYDAAPLPRMLDLSGRKRRGQVYDGPVIYMGTLSKEIAPGLRIGWVIAAPEMIEAMTLAKQGSDMCCSGVSQRIALAALDSGLIERTKPAVLSLYRARRDALCAALHEHLSDWFDWEVPVGGMFVWAVARNPALDTDLLLPAAIQAGVCIAPSSVFDPTGEDRRAIRLNFTRNAPDRLVEGIRRLATALRGMSTPVG